MRKSLTIGPEGYGRNTFRIAVKPDAKHLGGINIFGRGFGNYDQDIILRLHTAS
jgi:predicted transcriptional regulator